MVIIVSLLLGGILGAIGGVAFAEQTSNKAPRTLNVNGVRHNVDVEIAAGAAGDEALANGVYIFRLKCSADLFCSFERVTLNECTAGSGGGPTFSTRVDSWVTSSGLLAVKQLSNNDLARGYYASSVWGIGFQTRVTLTFASEGAPALSKTPQQRKNEIVDLRFWPSTKSASSTVTVPQLTVEKCWIAPYYCAG